MPLTPFHLGPGLLIGLALFSLIDFPTVLVASVIIDVEPFLVLTFNLDLRVHGFFHSFVGGTIVALLLAVAMHRVNKLGYLSSVLRFFKLEQQSSFKRVVSGSILGIYVHILLDSLMHSDIRPFYPFDWNPIRDSGILSILSIYVLCLWCTVGALMLFGARMLFIWKTRSDQKHTRIHFCDDKMHSRTPSKYA